MLNLLPKYEILSSPLVLCICQDHTKDSMIVEIFCFETGTWIESVFPYLNYRFHGKAMAFNGMLYWEAYHRNSFSKLGILLIILPI